MWQTVGDWGAAGWNPKVPGALRPKVAGTTRSGLGTVRNQLALHAIAPETTCARWRGVWETAGARGRRAWQATSARGAVGWSPKVPGALRPRAAGTTHSGLEPRILESAALGAGIRAHEGGLRLPSRLPARKNAARLRFNFAGGSSPKPCKPSTCDFANAPYLDAGPIGFKTQTRGFFGPPGAEARESGPRTCCWPPSRGDWHHL